MIFEKHGGIAPPPVPLSYQQERVWNLPMREEDVIPPMALRVKGLLDQERFAGALTEITRRQGVFRTRFEYSGSFPRQLVSARPDVDFDVIDLRDVRREDRDSETLRVIQRHSMIPFDVQKAPLMRVRLVCLEERECVLIFFVHHLIGDLWSMKILWRELAHLYAARLPGASVLPTLPVQYADYAVEQRSSLVGPVLEKHISYLYRWAHSASEATLNSLPVSGTGTTRRGGVVFGGLSARASAALKRVSREQRVTSFMMFLALFQMFVCEYLGVRRLLVAAMVANRPRTELESIIGVFATSLSLLIDTPPTGGLSALLHHTRDVCLDAYANQPLPLWQLSQLTNQNLDGALLRPRLSLSLQTAPPQAVAIPGVEVTEFACNGAAVFEGEASAIAPFDQAWEIWEAPDAYKIVVLYRQCFQRPLIEDMLQTFLKIVESVLDVAASD